MPLVVAVVSNPWQRGFQLHSTARWPRVRTAIVGCSAWRMWCHRVILFSNRKYKDYVYGGCKYMSTWKNKQYLRSKIKPKNYMMYQDIYNCICQNTKKWRYTIHYVKPIAQLLFKNRGKWLIQDTKRRMDNQLQSLKLPCRISKLSS